MARLELVSGLNGRTTVFSAIIFLIHLVIRNHSFNFVFTSLYKLLPLHFFQQSLPGLNLIFFARLKTHLLNIQMYVSNKGILWTFRWGTEYLCVRSNFKNDRDFSWHYQCAGTMFSGLSAFCCGKSRMHSRENKLMTVCCVNIMVGTMQFFTATLLLVGWAWSLVWGIYMVILAGKNNHSRRFQHFIYN